MTSRTNYVKRAWDATKAGKVHKNIKQFYADESNSENYTDKDQRWVDQHRAKSLVREGELVKEFEQAQKDLRAEYKDKFDAFMLESNQTEWKFLQKVLKR